MADQPMSLGAALPLEMARVRDEVLPHYLELGNAGMFAVAVMRSDLDVAAKALAEGDIPLMIAAYESLKGCKL
jgi:hypothetical protein